LSDFPLIGVLALQGAFREHALALSSLGAGVREVRVPEDLLDLDGLVIPGGESTTIGKLMETFGLREPLLRFAERRAILGTCAGLILLARATVEGSQPLLGLLDIVVRRNAFGRQVHSFEGAVRLRLGSIGADSHADFPGVFIRAPWVEEVGPGVEVVATVEDRIVGVRQGHLLGFAFHPELTDDRRIHEAFLTMVAEYAHGCTLAPVA
jgi:5'-phosphate synthase pdxT subunit